MNGAMSASGEKVISLKVSDPLSISGRTHSWTTPAYVTSIKGKSEPDINEQGVEYSYTQEYVKVDVNEP